MPLVILLLISAMSLNILTSPNIDLNKAIDAWISNETSATATYGDINTWDVSAITDFSYLFDEKNFSILT